MPETWRGGLGRYLRRVLPFWRARREHPGVPTADSIARQLDAEDYTGIVTDRGAARRLPDTEFRGRWEGGIGPEVEHWTRYLLETVKTDERERFRIDPELPLAPEMTDRIVAAAGEEVRILDVGAGPLTTVGKRWAGHRVRVVAVDALADRYDRLLDQAGIVPPVRTLAGEAERLTEQFPTDHFDFVYCANALDHCWNPLAAIDQMLAVVKPGGHVLLRHFPNEAETEAYTGFHQWNLWSHRGHLVIWNRGTVYLIDAVLAGRARVEMVEDGRLVTCYLQKAPRGQ